MKKNKKSKFLKFEIESTTGTAVDLSAFLTSYKITDADGNLIDQYDRHLEELDAKYEIILAEIVKNHPRPDHDIGG